MQADPEISIVVAIPDESCNAHFGQLRKQLYLYLQRFAKLVAPSL